MTKTDAAIIAEIEAAQANWSPPRVNGLTFTEAAAQGTEAVAAWNKAWREHEDARMIEAAGLDEWHRCNQLDYEDRCQ